MRGLWAIALTGCIVSSAIALTNCIVSSRIGPGVMNPGMGVPRRDPDPTRAPNEEPTTSPWVPEAEAAKPGTKQYEAERALATIAAILAGAAPMLMWSGTFEENLLAPKRARPTVEPTTRKAEKDDWWPPANDAGKLPLETEPLRSTPASPPP